jgi:uncharacterized repeat protein (TIGR03847 family)
MATLLLEKAQARTLAEQLLGVLPEVEVEEVNAESELREPLEPAWRVGEIVVGVDADQGKVAFVAREQVPENDPAGAVARIFATIDQARSFARQTVRVCEAGRPACPVCALPMEPEGHICPRLNGHRV